MPKGQLSKDKSTASSGAPGLPRARRQEPDSIAHKAAAVKNQREGERLTASEAPASLMTALLALEAALEKKAADPLVLDMRQLAGYTDFFVICSGGSGQHLDAITESIEEHLRLNGHKPSGIEGRRGLRWVLMDYGDVIVHVFERETREFYGLEKLWLDAPRIPVEVVKGQGAGRCA